MASGLNRLDSTGSGATGKAERRVQSYQDKGEEQKLVRLGHRSNESYVPEKAGAARAKHFHQGYRRIEPRGAQYSHRSMQSRDGFQWSARTSFEEFNAFTRSFLQPSEQRAVYRDFPGYDIKRILSRHSSDYGNRNVLKVLNSNIKKADDNGSPVIVECLIRYALHAGIPVDVPILNACITAYGNAARHDAGLYWIKKAEAAAALFETLKLTQNVTTLSARITAYGNAARHDAGLNWINKAEDVAALFETLKLTQNVTTLNACITAYGNAARHDAGLYWIKKAEAAAALFETLKLTQDVTTLNARITAYGNAARHDAGLYWIQKAEAAAALFETLKLTQNVTTLNALITAYGNAARHDAGLYWIKKAEAVAALFGTLKLTQDVTTLSARITAYGNAARHDAGLYWIQKAEDAAALFETLKLTQNVTTLSARITAYGNAARHDAGLYWIKKAEAVAALFETLKLTQDVTTLNARITAYGNAARHDAGLYWIKKAEDAAALFEKLKLTQNVTTLNALITAYGNAARHDAGLYWIQKAEDAAALFETLKLTQDVTTLEALISAYANVALFCSIKDTAEKYQSRAFALLDNLVEKKVLCGTLGIQEGESKPDCLTIDFHHSALTGKAGITKISEIITTDVAVAVLMKHLNSTKDQKNINMLRLITGYRHGIHYRAAFEVVLRRQSRVARYETDTSNQGLMTVWLSSVSG